jgi:AcrR family transcriptional regulator
MAAARKRRPYHHGDLRRALLDATLALAGERGAAGVTLREAARVAGVSQTAPYRHFPDKQAMLAAASEEGFHLFHQQVQQALTAAGDDPRARLGSLGEAYVRFALAYPSHFRLMYGQGSPPKSASPGLQAAARASFQLLLGTVKRCQGARAPRIPAQELTRRLWALAHGMATLALEKQILFDTDAASLASATRKAVQDLID